VPNQPGHTTPCDKSMGGLKKKADDGEPGENAELPDSFGEGGGLLENCLGEKEKFKNFFERAGDAIKRKLFPDPVP